MEQKSLENIVPAMPAADNSVQKLMIRLADGSHGAAADVFGRTEPRLLAAARKWLQNSPLRGTVEPEDVVQSALMTFWNRMQDGRLRASGFQKWDDVWNALVLVARRRVIRRQRNFFAEKRGGGQRNVPLFSEDGSVIDVADGQARPETLVICDEILEILLSEIDEACQATVLYAIAGHSKAEIAEMTGVTTRSVNRRLEFARKILVALMQDEEAEGDGSEK